MAEAAGLVLGAVGVASMFSTCIDLFDRLQLGLRYATGAQLAINKIDLLRLRFSKWGESLGIGQSGWETSPALRRGGSVEQGVVTRSLIRIRSTLEDASNLGEKHRAVADSQLAVKPTFFGRVRSSVAVSHRLASNPPSERKSSNSLRKRTAWAFHDKRELDDLIKDLEFLLGNLEKVVSPVMSPSGQQPSRDRPRNESGSGNHGDASDSRPQQGTTSSVKPEKSGVSSSSSSKSGANGDRIKVVDSGTFTNVFHGHQENADALGIVGGVATKDCNPTIRSLFFTGQNNSKGAVGIMGTTSPEAIKEWQAQSDRRSNPA